MPVYGYADVPANSWSRPDVDRTTALGIFNGYDDGYFRPERNVTCAEFTKVLMMCVGETPAPGAQEKLFPEHWASPYISLAYSLGIITESDMRDGFSPDEPITRLLMTRMTVRALALEPAYIKSPFADTSDPYVSAAYRAYLLRGYITADGRRVANGRNSATRAEAAAIAVRILDYRADSYEYKKQAILENARSNYLDTEAELMDLFYVLNRELYEEFTFYTHLQFEEWYPVYADTKLVHFEYFFSSECVCSYIPGNNMYVIKLKYPEKMSVMKQQRDSTEKAADRIMADIITDGMTVDEKVRAIHDYIVLNCVYDYEGYAAGRISDEAYTAYGALCMGRAVCQGYTNAFNLLCKKAGVPSITVMGTAPGNGDTDHAWNLILKDGRHYGVDTTFDDPVPDVAGRIDSGYFMMTPDEMKARGYVWDESQIKMEYFH